MGIWLKKTGILFLCILFLYNSMGYMVAYVLMRDVHRKQVSSMVTAMPDSALTVFQFEKGRSPRLARGGACGEVVIGGKLYDVVRFLDNEDAVTFFCLEDDLEEQLKIKLLRMNDNNGCSDPVQQSNRQILDQVIKTALLSQCLVPESFPVGIRYGFTYHHAYPNPPVPIPGPPPQA